MVFMEGITLAMALVDAVPVVLFGASMVVLAGRFGSWLFALGAIVSTLAGCCKVAWKGILGTTKKNIPWLNRVHMPGQMTGFCLMLLSFVLHYKKISWPGVWEAVTGFPSCLFLLLWVCLMGVMGWYRKHRFDNSPRANWTAQGINCAAQAALLLGILL